MKITEKDIFSFVFSPANLNAKKRIYLQNNRRLFEAQIAFLEKLKKTINFKDVDSTQEKKGRSKKTGV
jgi:hypothetical protein